MGVSWRFRAEDLGPVHTNPFSNENRAVLLRIWLSSTLQYRKRSPKMESFENALQRGAFWKRCFLVWTVKTMLSENGDVIQIDTTGRQPTRPWVSKMASIHYFMRLLSNLSLDDRCSVDGRKRYENDKCGFKSFWKRSKTAPFSFENGLVWTGH